MSDEMSPWRSLASAATRHVKSYVSQRDFKKGFPSTRSVRPEHSTEGSSRQGWGQWVGQKLRNLGQGSAAALAGNEKVLLFPGWATRRYHGPHSVKIEDDAPFDVEVFVSGFCTRASSAGLSTRPGRAFLRLARSYAGLPKLVAQGDPSTGAPSGLSLDSDESSEDLSERVHLPPTPDEMNQEAEVRELQEQFKRLEFETSSNQESSVSSHASNNSSRVSPSNAATTFDSMSNNLRIWHANLEARLQPFWSSSLSSRTIRISLYATDPSLVDLHESPLLNETTDDEYETIRRPIATREITTTADGFFQGRFSLKWENICVHPAALHIAFGDPAIDSNVFILAELLSPPSRPPTPSATSPMQISFSRSSHHVDASASAQLMVPLTRATVRVISDIDDTVKFAGILQGARAAFHNVFVKNLSDIVIPGMGEWYTSMWRRGVRFHYVSNSPFELLPIINEFFQLAHLPPGSIKLKSYGGRQLFNGLLSAPAERKRAGVMDILNNFPDAQFFLVGDSGEQDLELYASIASGWPNRILAIFIRDASNYDRIRPLEDPTGDSVLRQLSEQGFGSDYSTQDTIKAPKPVTSSSLPNYEARRPPLRASSDQSPQHSTPRLTAPTPSRTHSLANISSSFPPSPIRANSRSHSMFGGFVTQEPTSLPTTTNFPPPPRRELPGYFSSTRSNSRSSSMSVKLNGQPPMTEAEKKQAELQLRVRKARIEIPPHIPLRIFRDPRECAETAVILDTLHIGQQKS